MPTRPDNFPKLAAKKATSPEVAGLFRTLTQRAETYAKLQDEHLESIIKHREARTGKPRKLTKGQAGMLQQYDKDAEQAVREIEQRISAMNDDLLLAVELSGHRMQLKLNEDLYRHYRPEDQETAQRLLSYRRETIQLIESFIESSPFKGKVKSLWKSEKTTGGALYIVLERKIQNLDNMIDGKMLSRLQPRLDEVAKQLGVRPLMEFFSINPKEASDFLEGEGVNAEIPAESWFTAEEGLVTVHVLIKAIETRADLQKAQPDLFDCQRVLQEAHKHDIKWHLAVDF